MFNKFNISYLWALFVSKGYYKNALDGLDPDRDICNWEEIVILFETLKKLRGIKEV